MRFWFFLIVSVLISSPLLARPFYIFANSVNIRERPTVHSKVIINVNAGTLVKVEEKTKIKAVFFNSEDVWYKIDVGGKKGYVWGGLITPTYEKVDFDNDGIKEVIMIKNFTFKRTDYNNKLFWGNRIRVFKNHRLVFDKKIPKHHAIQKTYTSISKVTKVGFPAHLTIIQARHTDEWFNVGGDKGTAFFIFRGLRLIQRLHFGTGLAEGNQASSYRYIFPWDKKGKQNRIRVFLETVQFDVDKVGNLYHRRKIYFEYYWNGRRFQKSKRVIGNSFTTRK